MRLGTSPSTRLHGIIDQTVKQTSMHKKSNVTKTCTSSISAVSEEKRTVCLLVIWNASACSILEEDFHVVEHGLACHAVICTAMLRVQVLAKQTRLMAFAALIEN